MEVQDEEDTSSKEMSFISRLEKLLNGYFIFSTSFSKLSLGNSVLKRQLISLVIIMFLVLQVFRLLFLELLDLVIESDASVRRGWGSLYYFIGIGEKILYGATITNCIQAIILRSHCFIKEFKRDLFILQDMDAYNNFELETSCEVQLRFEHFAQRKVAEVARRLKTMFSLAILIIGSGGVASILSEDSITVYHCCIWIFWVAVQFFTNHTAVGGTLVISILWHLGRYHCELLVNEIIMKMENIVSQIQSKKTTHRTVKELNEFFREFSTAKDHIDNFNRFSCVFISTFLLTSTVASSCILLSSWRTKSKAFSYVLNIFFIGFAIEPMSVMSSSYHLHTKSMELYRVMNACFVGLMPFNRRSLRLRLTLRKLIKHTGDLKRNSLTLKASDGSPCTPLVFVKFIGSAVSFFMLMVTFIHKFFD